MEKTNNFKINLMLPDQAQKDIVFNESMILIDQFLKNTIDGFKDKMPDSISIGEKFIIKNGDNKNKICFLSHDSKQIALLDPTQNTLVFVKEEQCFFIFDHNNWTQVNLSGTTTSTKNDQSTKPTLHALPNNFTGIEKEYNLPLDMANHYLYLSNNCIVKLVGDAKISEITILIKQHWQKVSNITWPSNILWENQKKHIITQTKNTMDIVKIFYLPESQHFLGKIISQNHTY